MFIVSVYHVVAYQSYVDPSCSLFHFLSSGPLKVMASIKQSPFHPVTFTKLIGIHAFTLHPHRGVIEMNQCFFFMFFSNVCLNKALMLANYGLTVQLYTSALASTQY